MTNKDQVMPDGRWVFDGAVAEVFDDMLSRSIPQYDVMRKAVYDLGRFYVSGSETILDLGCSRGEAMAPFVERFTNPVLGIEISEPMREAARRRFEGYPRVSILDYDLRDSFPNVSTTLVLSVLTLQFIPIEYRQRIVRQVYESLRPGGAFILVEKVLGDTARLNDQMVKTYYDLKSENGYSDEQIERKRLSLEGVLVPITARWNEEMLRSAGFVEVDTFWRWFNFAGWIAVK